MNRMITVLRWWIEDWRDYPRIVARIKELIETIEMELG